MFRAIQLSIFVLFACVLAGSFGCGGNGPRKAVFGKIAGAEGRSGSVTFIPAAGVDGPTGSAEIVDGAYQCNADQGPGPGAHEARILLESGAAVPTAVATPTNPNPKITAPVAAPSFDSLPVEHFNVPVTVPEQSPYQVDIQLPGK